MVKRVWAPKRQSIKVNAKEKDQLLAKVSKFIYTTEKLAKLIYHIKIYRGRIYLTYLHEIQPQYRSHKVNPLIEGKYEEYNFARITLFDINGTQCTADWQRHNLKWHTVHEGSLKECLTYIEEDFDAFSYPLNYKVMNSS